MPSIFEPNAIGPSDRSLAVRGVVVLIVLVVATAVLLAKSTGGLERQVQVTAELINVGDGLPARSDVKYRGMLVGAVTDVIPAEHGVPNLVRLDLKPDFAKTIPSSVTARVVPSNVFAVSSVQLVDRGEGRALQNGDRIAEDTELPTVLFQTTVSKLRDILAAGGRSRGDNTVGILETLAKATAGRGDTLLASGAQLTRLLDSLNSVIATDTDVSNPSTLSALVSAAHDLKATAPDLFDSLHQAVVPMRTFAEKRSQLQDLLNKSLHTIGTTRAAFDNHTDRLISITTDLTPVVGVLAERGESFTGVANKLSSLSAKLIEQAWDPVRQRGNLKAIVSFTPTTLYTREDCPRYGELEGPSCQTAPTRKSGGVTPDVPPRAWPDLPPQLLPEKFIPPPGLGSLPPDVGKFADPSTPIPPAGANDAAAQPSSYGGNVGPVGSPQERDQLGTITGTHATSATQLLLGPVARGTTAHIVPPSSPAGQETK
ncbi:MCE family protein [Mycobacteroides sp. LB1]|uniref:MlaD family protein n=1 Tax=Mycobacteroides sp. LB1 TaxID=2750814 RepID=UPI0015DE1870|nr:MCE family protein [Mycobacteroides sp. LB1]